MMTDFTSGRVLRVVDVDTVADNRGDGREIAFVRADDEIAAPQGAFDDAGVDDVGDAGAAGQGSSGPGPGVVEGFGFASGQEPGELRLAGSASPALGYHRGRYSRYDASEQQGAVAGPHSPLAAFGSDQCPGIVGDPGHAVRRVAGGWVILAAHSSASAISSGVNGPCSASYWPTASKPSRMMNSFRAVWAIQAL